MKQVFAKFSSVGIDLSSSEEEILNQAAQKREAKLVWLAGFFILALLSLAVSLTWAPGGPDLAGLVSAISGTDAQNSAMVFMMRLPRLCMGLLSGLGLGVAGCVAQAVLRNPLASPFTLGISSGAAFGAALAMIAWPAGPSYAVPGLAIFFSLATSAFSLGVSRLRRASRDVLILSGVAVMFLFSALTSYIQYTAPQMDLQRIVFWSFGSLAKAGWTQIAVAVLMILPALPWLVSRAFDLNLILLGDENAASLGLDVKRFKTPCILAMSLISAGAICFCGVIGFIGLVAPHMARLAVGSDHRYLLPASGLLGICLVILADLIGRALYAPLVIPVGIMTSFLGVPFFFWLLFSAKRRGF